MHSNPLLNLKNEDLAIAHRQWIRANRIKEYFEGTLARTEPAISGDVMRFYLSDAGVFMFLWYSLLYSIIEFLENKKVVLTDLDDEFDSLKDNLRKSRNSVFHAENKYWDKRQIELIAQPQAGQRIRRVHGILGNYFLEAMKKS